MTDYREAPVQDQGRQQYWLTSNSPGKYRETRQEKAVEIGLGKKKDEENKAKKALFFIRKVFAIF